MQLRLAENETQTDFTTLDSGDTLYVHLCTGEVISVNPATAVRVTASTVDVLNRERIVATFDRDDVYFAADEDMEPPSLE